MRTRETKNELAALPAPFIISGVPVNPRCRRKGVAEKPYAAIMKPPEPLKKHTTPIHQQIQRQPTKSGNKKAGPVDPAFFKYVLIITWLFLSWK
jgi:hypothetical protein